jgi:ribosome maturation factor RimP
LDADDGITIDKCIRINRALYRRIEEAELFPEGDFSMEVSSPGVDQPLKLNRQYRKNIGRTVEVMFEDNTKKEGKLVAVTDDEITIEEKEGTGKKAIIKSTNISFNQIKHTKVLVTF